MRSTSGLNDGSADGAWSRTRPQERHHSPHAVAGCGSIRFKVLKKTDQELQIILNVQNSKEQVYAEDGAGVV